jgi:beta-lactamase class A
VASTLDLGSGNAQFQSDTLFHAASTMKVPVMLEYLRALDAGRLPRASRSRSRTAASIVDGSTTHSTPARTPTVRCTCGWVRTSPSGSWSSG